MFQEKESKLKTVQKSDKNTKKWQKERKNDKNKLKKE